MSKSIAGNESPSISVIEESLSLLARRASLPRIHAYMNSRAGTQLDWYAYIALYWIDAAGPMRLTELAHHFGVVPSTVCRHVQQLEREGLVEKTADPTDGRAVQLAPSDKGRRILAELKQARESTLRRASARGVTGTSTPWRACSSSCAATSPTSAASPCWPKPAEQSRPAPTARCQVRSSARSTVAGTVSRRMPSRCSTMVT
jgi:DNA-binding MarR family transcriptional regulator